MGDIFAAAREETVEADNLVSLFDEPIAQMAAEKPGSAGNKNRMKHGDVGV